jgi:uncharacterized membrane protein (DUF2068 family)
MNTHRSVRIVAAFEAFKGAVVLLAASGLLLIIHRNLFDMAAQFIAHLHLDPASRYPKIFLDAAANLKNQHFKKLALGAAAYSSLRFVESYGLFREAAWAEILAAVSGGIYIPFEVESLWDHATWMNAGALLINLLIVTLMIAALLQRRGMKS